MECAVAPFHIVIQHIFKKFCYFLTTTYAYSFELNNPLHLPLHPKLIAFHAYDTLVMSIYA